MLPRGVSAARGCDEGYVAPTACGCTTWRREVARSAILLHGFPEFWYSWRYQLPALAAIRRVVALDLRGYNLSDKPPSGYDLATLDRRRARRDRGAGRASG